MNYSSNDSYFNTYCDKKKTITSSVRTNTTLLKYKPIDISEYNNKYTNGINSLLLDYYLYDPHVHTSEVSFCGQLKACEMVRLYKAAGYQGIVITDHYFNGYIDSLPSDNWKDKMDAYLSGYRSAKKAGDEKGLDILLGMELRFDEGPEDYLVYGFDEDFLFNNPYLNKLGLKSFKQLIKGTGILIFQAHPFRLWLKPAPAELLDGVEVYNGNPRHNSGNDKAYAYAAENGLYMLAGSDAHQPQDVGLSGIAVPRRLTDSSCLTSAVTSGDNEIILVHGQ